mgnify:CR=1 FL=1
MCEFHTPFLSAFVRIRGYVQPLQFMNQLNPQQQEAVRYIDSPLLVLAGAGSGKTSVITQKIAYLIRECEMPAHRIMAVTFTNKAAREMKERVGQLLVGTNSRGLTVSTFHTLGLKILKAEKKHLGLRNGFTIFDSQDSQALLKDLMHPLILIKD